ncbi:hypothetical protein GCM10027046_25760 [Uliginosibacterium flavum]|uniref:Glycine zipper 2TM domain-containing protein n=1 Tax=Uliginosibacterium flavum TaxID=1396831 RepID=A0ABV2TPD9_9RHOO
MNTQFRPALALITLLALPGAQAADFTDHARVLDVVPRVQQVNEPREECHTEYRRIESRERGPNAGALIGGVAGAILGHQVGRGGGRDAATAVGAITGAIVGNQIGSREREIGERPERICRLVDNWVSRTDSYDVRYEYQGHEYSAVLPYDPGRRLRLHVSITPDE